MQYDINGKLDCLAQTGSTPLSCFKLHVDYGISNSFTWNSPGFIEPNFAPFNVWIPDPYWAGIASGVFGSAYNMFYFVCVGQVLQAIISGLIIDTFGKMREENEENAENMRSMCFACSLSRDSFERNNLSFVKVCIITSLLSMYVITFCLYIAI